MLSPLGHFSSLFFARRGNQLLFLLPLGVDDLGLSLFSPLSSRKRGKKSLSPTSSFTNNGDLNWRSHTSISPTLFF